MQYKRKRKAAREEKEGGEGSKGTPARVDEESSSGSKEQGTAIGGSCGRRTGKMPVIEGGWHVWMLGR